MTAPHVPRSIVRFTPTPHAFRCESCRRWRFVSVEYAVASDFDAGEPGTYPKRCRSCLWGGADIPAEAAPDPEAL